MPAPVPFAETASNYPDEDLSQITGMNLVQAGDRMILGVVGEAVLWEVAGLVALVRDGAELGRLHGGMVMGPHNLDVRDTV